MLQIKDSTLSDFDSASELEWLEANGLGGYASASLSGANTRRYHGLLVASLNPPVNRMVVVSKLEESIVIGENQYQLSCNQYPGVIYPDGCQHLSEFEQELFPVFTYSVGNVLLRKTIAAIHGENTTIVHYEVIAAPEEFEMALVPMYSCRDIHSLTHANDAIGQHYLIDKGVFRTMNYQGCPEFFISVPGSTFTENKMWFYNIEHNIDRLRGMEFREDLYSHGKFSLRLRKGDSVGVILSLTDPKRRNAIKLLEGERKRREDVVKNFTKPELQQLARAADQFIVKRAQLNTVVAGYHWFTDWGRDTMIALPGLCLIGDRTQEAKKILKVFAENMSQGMLPNRFPDHGEAPEYNTIDATLWYFNAVYQYYKQTNDLACVKSILPVLKESINHHIEGTRYHIHVDAADDLLCGGEDGIQLTWMDAKVGDWVVTPRKGKCVEINALWYNALCIMEELLIEVGDKVGSILYRDKAQRVQESFNKLFWNERAQCLYDFVDGDTINDDIRPNQIFSVSLPFAVLQADRWSNVVTVVKEHLLTPRGLRSLSPANHHYKPFYEGGVLQRDGAYHQGTVWSFLLGPYVDALLRVDVNQKSEASKIISEFLPHLLEAGIGTVSEIFDGNAPHRPKGCIAQAWGVAEILRVIVTYNLLAR